MLKFWLARLKSVVWPAVSALALAVVSVAVALVDARNSAQAAVIGIAAVTMALLAQRA